MEKVKQAGKYRSCIAYKEVHSPALGKKVKRCAEYRAK